ncbi:hypothetical protein SDC9_115077 [bioreactor metagenome]|uniref:Uncharacterized protein n=1 Tax=bioreactor metagenome TaxID=1076179 RepID=A0A645BS00_9ZZZZ
MRRLLPLGTVAGVVAVVVSMMSGVGESVHLDDTRVPDAGVRNAYKHTDLRDTAQTAVSSAALPLEAEAQWNDLLARSG